MQRLAQALSILLHPLFMPVFTVALALWLDPHLGYFLDRRACLIVLAMVGLMTVAFPLFSILLLIRSGLLSGLQMPTRKERIAPYCMNLIYYVMAWFLLARTPLHPMVPAFMAGAAVALLLTTLITLRWKISAHMVGMGGSCGALLTLGFVHQVPVLVPLAIAVAVAGALGTARLLTSDHTPAQVCTGFFVGAVSTFVCAQVPWPVV